MTKSHVSGTIARPAIPMNARSFPPFGLAPDAPHIPGDDA
jgi:hypothetical protein